MPYPSKRKDRSVYAKTPAELAQRTVRQLGADKANLSHEVTRLHNALQLASAKVQSLALALADDLRCCGQDGDEIILTADNARARLSIVRRIEKQLNELSAGPTSPTGDQSSAALWIASLETRKEEFSGVGETEEQAIGALYGVLGKFGHGLGPEYCHQKSDIETRRIVSGECYWDKELIDLNSTKGKPMKRIKTMLTPKARSTVNQIGRLMMKMNADVRHEAQSLTYGHLYEAMKCFVKIETGIEIGNTDWNLGGSYSYADDIQAAINEVAGRRS